VRGFFLPNSSNPGRVQSGIVLELYKTTPGFGLGLPKGIMTLMAV
jgi:hypothetical protein